MLPFIADGYADVDGLNRRAYAIIPDMKAMILAAGEGTRLRPLTLTVPKPMVPVVGRPLLAWTLAWLAEQGIDEVVINLYHRPQVIPDFFGEAHGGLRLHYFCENELQGTSGGVRAAAELLDEAPFFVIYGDNLLRADLSRLINFHEKHGGEATLALFHHPNPAAAGVVGVDSTGRITRFVEKPAPDQIFADTANAGVYLLNPSVLEMIPTGRPSDFGRDIFPTMLGQGRALYGIPLDGYLQDTGTPDQYRRANWDVLEGRLGKTYAKDGVWTGQNTHVSPTVEFRGRNILGSGVTVAEGASLTDCIVWDNARIGAGARLENAIVGYGVTVEPGSSPGAGAIVA